MAGEPAEKRKFRRYEVDSINGKMLYSSDINILNISVDGAAIATTQRLSLGREYVLNLHYENSTLKLTGKIVWELLSHSKTLKTGEVVPVYKAGVKFSNVMTEKAADLIRYIEKNRTGEKDKRIFGVRFNVSRPDKAIIDIACEYDIRKISLAGMLIETDMRLEIGSEYEMELYLDRTPVTVTGRISNIAETAGDGDVTYDIGVEFVRIPEEGLKALSSFIEARKTKF